MDGEIITASNQSLDAKTSHAGLHIMVVDDDVICLSIVAAILKTWKYEVVTIKSAQDAINTLRTRNNFFHLIVTDVHMPEMDGFEFQRLVHEEFRLPVVMMSADDKESSMLRGLEAGAVFYIVKPIGYDDLKNLWQYTVTPKKGKSHVVIQEIRSGQGEKTSDNEIESLINEEKNNNRDYQKKTLKKGCEGGNNGKEKGEAAAPKKAKVIWTAALHNRFLEAARKIGLERAVPKRILEIMNVPGLTRENVASHLQKYRIFLKRVMETSSHGGITGKNISDKTLRSSFATGHPSLMINTLQKGFPQFLDHHQVGSSLLQPRFLGNLPTANSLSHSSPAIFPNQQASSSSLIPQLGYGQTHSMNKQNYLQQPTFGNTSSMQIYQQKTQPRSEFVPNSWNSGTNNFHGIQNNGVNNSEMALNLAGSSQMGFAGGDMLNEFNGGFGLIEGNNNSTKLASLGNVNSGIFADQGASSTRFSNVIQQENNKMLLSLPLLPQQNNLGEGGEDNGYLLGQVRNNISTPMENLSIPQIAENDLNDLHEILGQIQPKYPSYNEKQSDGGIITYDHGSGMNKLDGYFPIFDPPYSSQQQGAGVTLEHGAYNLRPELNPTWNIQSADNDIMVDSMFGAGMYEGGSNLPRI